MQLGKYRLIRKLGRGGMGEVWEGLLDGDLGFERRVAVKCMGARGDAFEQRFLDEARIASRLHHANIVSVLDFGVDGETWYQVLELINGIDAHHLMDRAFEERQAVPTGLALHICAEVAHGLSAAHTLLDDNGRSLGIVHRDVSLDNILISWAGDVKLGDFGVAKARGQAHHTLAGSTVGKVSYMAPEQATSGEIDARADLFALGCALHALLTRRTPLSNESAMMDLLAGKPLPVALELPEDVAAIITRSIQRSRTERFQSASEMAEALARARHQRLSEDPRSALAKYLERFRPKQTPLRVGALDAMLAPEGTPNTVNERTPQSNRTITAPFAGPPAPLLEKTVATPLLRRRGPMLGFIIATLAGATGVGTYAVLTRPPPRPVARVAPPPVVVAPVEPKVEPKPEPVVETPPPVVVEPVRPPPAKKRESARAPAPAGQGVVAVGGPGAQRAEILVDGQSQGFAPKRIELSCGAHEITLVKPGGDRIGPHRVDVTQVNTELEPLKWIVE